MTKIETQRKPELFDIPVSIWDTLDFDVVQDTYGDMFDAGLVHPPFMVFSIRIPMKGFLDSLLKYVNSRGDENININDFYKEIGNYKESPIIITFVYKKSFMDYKYRYWVTVGEGKDAIDWRFITGMPEEFCDELVSFVYKCLIVLLSARNTSKRVVKNDPRAGAKKARDDSARYSTTTYVSIGKITETMRGSSGQRGPVRAHLRRGHIRRQRFGENLAEEKVIFIAPVFVNADQEWITERRKYKLVR